MFVVCFFFFFTLLYFKDEGEEETRLPVTTCLDLYQIEPMGMWLDDTILLVFWPLL